MSLFTSQTLSERKRRAALSLEKKINSDDLLLFCSGEPIQKPGGLDQTYPFLPHPDYFWLTGSRRASGVVAFTKSEGFIEFVKPLSFEETLWEGVTDEVPGKDVSQLPHWIEKQQFQRIFVFGKPSSKLESYTKNSQADSWLQIQEAFNQARRVKDSEEIQIVQKAAQMAHKGYLKLQEFIRPGISERQIQIEYETEVLRAGAEKFPYDSIVGIGTNSAILHAIPTERIVKEGELVLIDAGADLHDYCVDITRVFPASGKWSQQQKDIFDIVLKAQTESIEKCQVGVEWHDVHKASARVIAEGLKNLNILIGETESLLESGAVSVFFPHGVGHMVGLRVRDVGPDITKPTRTCYGIRVRVDFALQENFLMTVEPGLYFVRALLNQKETREKFKDQIQWSEIEKWKNFGGIRLEDDILVTAKGPQNLTGFIKR